MNYKVIFWDFDGVIIDSMCVRDYGFEQIFKNYSSLQINKLLKYHRKNGGLSRYVKIRYFYEEILGESISDNKVNQLAEEFSAIMKVQLVNPSILISDAISFIKENYQSIAFHIVSGSDGQELQFLCKKLKIDHYFVTIQGSPTPKTELVKNLLNDYSYAKPEVALIGDSVNDYDAAKANKIDFFGYNNSDIMKLGRQYLLSVKEILTTY